MDWSGNFNFAPETKHPACRIVRFRLCRKNREAAEDPV